MEDGEGVVDLGGQLGMTQWLLMTSLPRRAMTLHTALVWT